MSNNNNSSSLLQHLHTHIYMLKLPVLGLIGVGNDIDKQSHSDCMDGNANTSIYIIYITYKSMRI